jgi:CPA2 family monovalent cation:H+ antiporter-2
VQYSILTKVIRRLVLMENNFLPAVLILLSAAVLIVATFKKINLSPVLGYFFAGAIIGDYGFGIVRAEQTEVFADFGVVFLLFAIGLELSFERLKSMRSQVFGFGTLQVIITSIVAGLAAKMFFHINIEPALLIGGGLALSSTAIVLQVLAESRSQVTHVGRLSLSILLMQDFAVVPLLVLVSLLSDHSSSLMKSIGLALGKAVIALVGIFILGRIFLRPLYGLITSDNSAKSNEIFIAATILIALGAAWGTEHMGLSMALGAFVAGLLVAETEFQVQAEESIAPFKGLLLGLFFMTVGMSINIGFLVKKFTLVAMVSISLVFIKALIIILLCLIFKFSIGKALHTGLLLAQGSEFAFILFKLASEKHLIKPELSQILMSSVTVTMAFTPLLSVLGRWLADKLESGREVIKQTDIYKEISDLDGHVILVGFGRVGKMVSRLFEAEKINYVVIDINTDIIKEYRRLGYAIYAGDGSRLEMLRALGIDRARAVIVSTKNNITAKKVAKTVRGNFPHLPVIVRTEDFAESEEMKESGVSIIVPETYETGLQLGGAVLKSIGINEYEVSRIKNRFRAGNYIMAKYDEKDLTEEAEENVYNFSNSLKVDDSNSVAQ